MRTKLLPIRHLSLLLGIVLILQLTPAIPTAAQDKSGEAQFPGSKVMPVKRFVGGQPSASAAL